MQSLLGILFILLVSMAVTARTCLLLGKATLPCQVKQLMQDHSGAKSANWLAG